MNSNLRIRSVSESEAYTDLLFAAARWGHWAPPIHAALIPNYLLYNCGYTGAGVRDAMRTPILINYEPVIL